MLFDHNIMMLIMYRWGEYVIHHSMSTNLGYNKEWHALKQYTETHLILHVRAVNIHMFTPDNYRPISQNEQGINF